MISQPSGAEIYRPHHERIRRIFTGAWTDYQAILKEHPYLADYDRARANLIHAAMKSLAQKEFGEGVENVRVMPHDPDSFMVVFRERLFTRFKKLDRDLRPSNVSTDQNDEMMRQMPLPQHGPNPSYPVAGYVLNELETGIESIHIVLPLGDYNLWSYKITDDGEIDNVIEMPTLWPLDDLTKTVIKPKRQIKPKEKKEDDEAS